MKKLLFIALVLFVSIPALGQEGEGVEVVISEDIKSTYWDHKIIDTNEGELILYHSEKKDEKRTYNLRKYDTDLKLLTTTTIELEEEERPIKFLSTANGQIHFFSFVNKKEKGKAPSSLYHRTLDRKSLLFNSKREKVTEIDRKTIKYLTDVQFVRYSFFIKLSPDSSKIMVVYRSSGDDEWKKNSAIEVYNEDMTPLWSSSIIIERTKKVLRNFGHRDFFVHNDGRVVIMVKKSDYTPRRSSIEDIELYVPIPNSDTFDMFEVDFEDKNNKDLTMRYTEEGDFIFSSFYSNPGFEFHPEGVFFCKVNGQTYLPEIKTFTPFTEKSYQKILPSKISSYSKGKFKKYKQSFFYKLRTRGIVHRDDGGIAIITEYEPFKVQTEDIIVFSISPEGKLDLIERIAKKQIDPESKRTRFGSFGLIVKEDKLHFFYNDNIKNLSLPLSGEPEKIRNTFTERFKPLPVFLVSLRIDGKATKQLLLDPDSISKQAVCYKLHQISDDEGIFYLVGEDYFNLVKVTLK